MADDHTPVRPANQRGSARLAAVQALYQMDIGEQTLEETLSQFESFRLGRELEGDQYLPADADYFRHIVRGVVQNQIKLDPVINAALQKGWPMTRIDATLRALLRAGVFELTMRRDIPFKVVIREYVDVANAFYEDEVPGMVNGVLDAVARKYSDGYSGADKA
ncbi:transcription antitermination factor NusB [Pelagibacterium lacus]|uniref:Transcription antitermination protein NusB n=1 Tax=Pelagibacterium lacus TaxID=2282655 RepID=A0A369W4P4_9HYPH|nr:transcription antitermination factor NusB [Pelagibacterium lacus]RDE08977.1 transcription antitermination factor NusB [Pelagibacterium lacus]